MDLKVFGNWTCIVKCDKEEELSKYDVDKFNDDCLQILTNNLENANHIRMKHSAKKISNKNIDYVIDLLFNIFTEASKYWYNKINNNITNFFPEKILLISKDFCKNTNIIKKYLSVFDKNTVFSNSNYNMSVFHVIKNYTFFKNVIDKEYDGKHMYILLLDYLKTNTVSIDTNILGIFRMFKYYNTFQKNIRDIGDRYKFSNAYKLVENYDNNCKIMFAKIIVDEIDTRIKTLLYDKTDIKKQIYDIVNYINTGRTICKEFIKLYEAKLEERLNSTNAKVEKELLTTMVYKDDELTYAKMYYCVNDRLLSQKYTREYQNIKLTQCSEKYKNINIDLSLCEITMVHGALNDSKENIECKYICQELEVYVDIFKKYYNTFHTHRTLTCMDDSTVSVEYKKQNLILSLAQYSVLKTILDLNKNYITYSELQCVTKISDQELSLILNSFIAGKIINKSDNNTISINDDTTDNNISLFDLYQSIKNNIRTVLRKTVMTNISDSDMCCLNKLMQKLKIFVPVDDIKNILVEIGTNYY